MRLQFAYIVQVFSGSHTILSEYIVIEYVGGKRSRTEVVDANKLFAMLPPERFRSSAESTLSHMQCLHSQCGVRFYPTVIATR